MKQNPIPSTFPLSRYPTRNVKPKRMVPMSPTLFYRLSSQDLLYLRNLREQKNALRGKQYHQQNLANLRNLRDAKITFCAKQYHQQNLPNLRNLRDQNHPPA